MALQTGELDRIRSSLIASGPADTAWIGHVVGPTGLPGVPGGYGPFHIGRGPNRILMPFFPPPAASFNGTWNFDYFNPGEVDSLMGWTPVVPPYIYTATTERTDDQRPWFALDYGNAGNYVINQGAPKRTHGVVGYWHRDAGALIPPVALAGTAPVGPTWAPIGPAFSAWCGLRAHGDVALIDPITGNAYNQTVLQHTDVGIPNFPGYGSQWDQMMYRDVFVPDGAGFAIAFSYSTNMSTGELTENRSRTGWFEWDPVKVAVPGDGNFISSSAPGLPRPVDAFQVYIGVPVNDAAVVFTDGSIGSVYDPQRRWLSEVIRFNGPKMKLLEATGVTPPGPAAIAPLPGGPGTLVQSILDAQPGAGGLVRVVFRVKTNRGFDDQAGGFSSGTAGAAIVDDIIINGWAPANGNFEAANSIDNSILVPPTAAWKTTGKPPGIYFHLHDLAAPGGPLPYDDPCGPVGGATRHCNLLGMVASAGDHDNAEKPGGFFGANDQDRRQWFASPTINLKSLGVGSFNDMGIDAEIADATGDYALWFDVYESVYDFLHTGNAYRVGWQSYPVLQPNGVPCWGPVQMPTSYTSSAGQPGCLAGFGGGVAGAFARLFGLIRTSNANGIPDSLRVYIESNSGCYTLPALTAATCSPTAGPLAGAYFDNLSLAFIDAPRSPRVSAGMWDLFNDAFPDNPGGVPPLAAGFNLLPARVKTGRNISQMTRNLARHDIPGDSAVVTAPGPATRMDLVFRIKPGVGNHPVVGVPGLVTTFPGGPVAVAGDGSFFGTYLANTGAFGTGGGGVMGVAHDPDGAGPIPPGTQWDKNAWNSAQMDTAEMNLFPAGAVDPNLAKLTPGTYVSQYIESEVAAAGPRAPLGVPKPRCVLLACAAGSPVNAANISCVVPPPAACTGPGSGFDPGEAVVGTLEYTKILPDGLFTPGTHIEYFFRRSKIGDPPAVFEAMPDTAIIYPQLGEGPNFDGHRWQEFSVLPDKWKDPAFGGLGLACMLVVDLGDRRGDELKWGIVAERGALTAPGQWGAHNGYRAVNTPEAIAGWNVSANDLISRRDNAGQPGTIWDLYQVKGGESNVPAGRLGSRGASQAVPGLAAGKFSTLGPTGDMLRSFYRILVVLGADVGAGSLGPIPDQTDNDIGAFNDFLTAPAGTPMPRGLIAIGGNVVEGQADASYGHPAFMPVTFGASLRNAKYRLLSGNPADVIDVTVTPPVSPLGGSLYGAADNCLVSDDVYIVNAAVPTAAAVSFYPPFGGGAPYVASVFAPSAGARTFTTLVDGWTLGLSGGGFGVSPTLAHIGAAKYVNEMLFNALPGMGCLPFGPPVAVGDRQESTVPSQFLSLRSSNPARTGNTRIAFGVARAEKVEVEILDIAGRLVRRVANRVFEPGEHVVVWDGTDESGQSVGSGVYFYRLKTPSFTGQRKLTLFKR